MKNTRNNVFETNSSSTHSVSIVENTKGIYDTLPVSEQTVILNGGEFGWEWQKYNDALTKANYATVFAASDKEKTKMLISVIKEHTGAKKVVIDLGDSYIDHQSDINEGGAGSEAFINKKFLKEFIFNPECILITGNDNEESPF